MSNLQLKRQKSIVKKPSSPNRRISLLSPKSKLSSSHLIGLDSPSKRRSQRLSENHFSDHSYFAMEEKTNKKVPTPIDTSKLKHQKLPYKPQKVLKLAFDSSFKSPRNRGPVLH